MLPSQVVILTFLVLDLLIKFYYDVNGRPAREPEGFMGILSSIIATVIVFALYYWAGTFSLIF